LEVETAFHVVVGAPSSTKVSKFLENVTKIQKKRKEWVESRRKVVRSRWRNK
jgi:hypothetical protein